MTKVATIVLLTLFSFTQTPLGQLLKLPVLIEHFQKHQEQNGDSLLGFLKDHYATEHQDADQSEDQQLPFKTVLLQNIGFAVVPGFLSNDLFIDLEIPLKVTLNDACAPQQHLSAIFHPPRI
jgi:hypothetical protein